MHPFSQVLLDGIFTGSTYALMAAGLALILGVVKVCNLPPGAFFSLGAYIAYVLSTKGVSRPAAAVLPAALIAFAFGVFLGKSFINPVRSPPFSVAVGTLGFAILFEQAAQLLWGPHPVSIGAGPPWAVVDGVVVRQWGAVSLIASTVILLAIALFLHSRFGLPVKLIAEEEGIAGSVGGAVKT